MRLNKTLYKKIKKMNREEMNRMLEIQFKLGFDAGVESSNNADLQIRLVQFLENNEIKGVGPVIKNRIIKALREGV